MIRIVLPAHLRTLARLEGEVNLDLPNPVTAESIVAALEARYPSLSGTIRDHGTRKRRPFVRFFACGEDVSHDPPDTPLPDAVATGAEPFLIIGAIAGGGAPEADPYSLARFVEAQAQVYQDVVAELQQGRKQSHWMWFIFPQYKGLGHSSMAQRYALGSRAEAEAYWNHHTLGLRLKQCAELVNAVENRRIDDILGYPDDLKFRSSMTLFAEVAPAEPAFKRALQKYFGSEPDTRTLELLAAGANRSVPSRTP